MSGDATTHRASQRAAKLEWATVAWNVMEVFVTIGLGVTARSVALIAFGLDSVVEIFASVVVVWQLRASRVGRERTIRALRLVGLAFFLLAACLLAGAIETLVSGRHPDDSLAGIAYLGVTAVVMFTLSWRKRALSDTVDSHPLVHEARITFLDGVLATSVLLALAANAALGWWWADPIAAILVALAAIAEGIQAPRQH
jgi:divalent metal cation (Fe/Co/Zn/Cd) transporter